MRRYEAFAGELMLVERIKKEAGLVWCGNRWHRPAFPGAADYWSAPLVAAHVFMQAAVRAAVDDRMPQLFRWNHEEGRADVSPLGVCLRQAMQSLSHLQDARLWELLAEFFTLSPYVESFFVQFIPMFWDRNEEVYKRKVSYQWTLNEDEVAQLQAGVVRVLERCNTEKSRTRIKKMLKAQSARRNSVCNYATYLQRRYERVSVMELRFDEPTPLACCGMNRFVNALRPWKEWVAGYIVSVDYSRESAGLCCNATVLFEQNALTRDVMRGFHAELRSSGLVRLEHTRDLQAVSGDHPGPRSGRAEDGDDWETFTKYLTALHVPDLACRSLKPEVLKKKARLFRRGEVLRARR